MRKKPLVIGALGLAALAAAVLIAEKKRGYSPATRPNPQAPAQTDQTVHIAASPARVWQVLSAIDQWPAWQPDILTAHLNGPLQAGTSFDWKSGGLTIHSTLHTVEPGQALGWSGAAFGAFAVHNWTLTPQDHSTEVRVEEGMEGWLVSLLRPLYQKSLAASITKWLELLRQEAERPAAV